MTDLITVKAELLCYGMSVAEDTRDILLKEYPHFAVKGFIDAVNAKVCGMTVCISIADGFALTSPYVLRKTDEGYFVFKGAEKFTIEFFGDLPKTGTVIDGLARLHDSKCINIWPNTNCCYDTPDLKCRFCSIECNMLKPIEPDTLCEGIKKLLEQFDGELNFSGGTYKNPDNMVDYWCEVAKKTRAFSNAPIAVEFAPPTDLSRLEALHAAGVNAAIMNLEIASSELRQKICPGKSRITKEHYHNALKKAVEVFGYGQVSSVLIGGIQPAKDIIAECELLTDMGVYPTIMPFRPMDNCSLSELQACKPEELIYMSVKLGNMLVKKNLDPRIQPGCTECGGCSIENDCFFKEKKK